MCQMDMEPCPTNQMTIRIFGEGKAVQITFGFPIPVAIVDTRINKIDVRRHVFGGRSKFEGHAKWSGFDLLDWEAKLSGRNSPRPDASAQRQSWQRPPR